MIIKLLGIEIRTGVDTVNNQPQQVQSTALVLHQPNGYENAHESHDERERANKSSAARNFFSSVNPLKDKRLHGVKVAMRSDRGKMVDDIVLPAPPPINDLLDSEIYINNVENFRKEMLEGSFFSICEVDKLMRGCHIQLNIDTKKSYSYLHSLHCKHYRDMSRHTFGLIVACLNYVFTEGSSPNPDDLFSPV